jgi:hypothetical protein
MEEEKMFGSFTQGNCLDLQRKLFNECPRRDIQQMADNLETVAS